MINKEITPDVFTYNTLISIFCRVNQLDKAIKFYNEMITKGIIENFNELNENINKILS